MLSRVSYVVPFVAYTVASFVVTLSIFMAKHHYDARQNFDVLLEAPVDVIPPSAKPIPSQESIDVAIAMFNINIPENADHPIYDPTIEDRGLTTLRGWSSKLEVAIGRSAFSSWAMLGSTLAHEIEVHCRQNFALIRLQDIFGYEGTLHAEREAYNHELANADRFRLDDDEVDNIRATMDFYYPVATDVGDDSSFSAR